MHSAIRVETVSAPSTTIRVRSKKEPWRSCSGYELLAQIIAAAHPTPPRSTACALQSELHSIAAQLGGTLGGPDGAFTLLQDCTSPPCCAHELPAFGASHPKATVLASGVEQRATTKPAALPSNLWTLTQRATRRA